MTILQIRLFGPLDIRSGDRQLPKPPTLKSQSLLAYLVLQRDQPQPRERLAGMFWGDRPEQKARSSLSTALWHIRRCLPDEELIVSDLHTVQFDPQADLWLDVEEFENQASGEEIGSLESAIALYRGDFLDGFYDDWIINERYRLEARFAEILERVMAHRGGRGDYAAMLTTAMRLLHQDPLREGAHRAAMRAYCRLGRRNAALEQYARCQENLQQALGVDPTAETTELYHEIRDGRFPLGPERDVASIEESVGETVITPGRNPLDAALSTPLVGRERELDFFRKRWQRARAGSGGLVLIRGEAGVGKTRLVEAFSRRARWKGARVLRGRCYEFERELPYQPFTEALRSVLPALNGAELRDLPVWTLEAVARLVPEMSDKAVSSKERLGSKQRPERDAGHAVSAAPAGQEQARLFDAMTVLLTELASHGPLLVTLEDLHWAPESTLALVHYLARRLPGHPILAVGTFRSEATRPSHPLLGLRRQLAQEDLIDQLRLSRLSLEATEVLLQDVSGAGQAIAPLARQLHRETLGNPLFLIETIRALFQAGELRLEGGAWQGDFARISARPLPLPAGVREVVEARVEPLREESSDALRMAAVLGTEFSFDLLDAIWGRGVEATLEALDELLRHRLLEESHGAMGCDYAFTHHKIREVVYAGMERRRRQHVHGLVGRTMERLYDREAEAQAGALAFHFEHGRQLDDTLTDKAIHYLSLAGDQARQVYACQEAIDYYQRGLALLKEQGRYRRAARTLMKMGLTYHNCFRFAAAQRAYEQGFAFWQRATTTEEAVSPPAVHTLRMSWQDRTMSLDPAAGGDVFSVLVLEQLFSGLVEHGPKMNVVPDLARSWEILDQGLRYVFHLRDDVHWSDGTPVLATDFEYAWKRVLDPAAGSPNATLLYDIKGARAYHLGESADPDCVAVRARDGATLVVELDEPAGYFLHLLAHSATCPVAQHVVEEHGEAWTRVANIVTNGPFKPDTWRRGKVMILTNNPRYHGPVRGNLRRIELTVLGDDPATGLRAYEADRLDLLDMGFYPPAEIDRGRRRHADEYVSSPRLYPSYAAFSLRRAPFDDLRVRQAFAQATDRKSLAGVALRGICSPATGGLVPPHMPGHTPAMGRSYDPRKARQLLADAGFPGGRDLPVVTLMMHLDPLSPVAARYLQEQWRSVLGVETRLEAVDWEQFFARLQTAPPHAVLWGFVADYPDPDNLLRVGMGHVLPYTGWEDKEYQNLVEQARRLTDQKERIQLYREADRILVEEGPILPLAYMRSHLLVKPWVRSLPISPISDRFWKDVIIEPH